MVVQIGTPYSVGTGFYLHEADVIITNEHVVRDNKAVILDNNCFKRCIGRVLYLDPYHDVAFLEAPAPLAKQPHRITLAKDDTPQQGEIVIALGHPFGHDYSATQGIISNTHHTENNIDYIQHDTALNPGNSGGPLINQKGEVIGINNFIMKDGNNMGFSLPIQHIRAALQAYAQQKEKRVATRCMTCATIVWEGEEAEGGYCGNCGSHISLASQNEDYEPSGIAYTIERFITKLGHDVRLCRMGHDHWMIQEGSASVKLYYNEKQGMIFGDAYLCRLPNKNIKPIYQFLLKENNRLENLSFSIPTNGRDIVLSLFIYDRYLNEKTGQQLFFNLFKKADYYDNILIEKYDAIPNKNWVDV